MKVSPKSSIEALKEFKKIAGLYNGTTTNVYQSWFSKSTRDSLEDLGWVEYNNEGGCGYNYRMTEKGRKALGER